jgi:hypothetical protein
VAHDPRDRSTTIVKGQFGHAIQWSELQPNRSQWKLPKETSFGSRQLLRRWKEALPVLAEDKQTRLTRSDYLGLVRDGVRFFSQFQDKTGAIIDPYKGEEFQYSTPCYAFTAALAAVESGAPEFLETAALAMDWSCQTLAERKAATGHEDFFPSPIAHALVLLADTVEPARLVQWRGLLAGFDPFATYRHKVGGSGDAGSNWNCKALSGEYLLHKAGVRKSLSYVEASLSAQGRLFDNEFGMYAEGPMVYDAFPRAWLGDMLAAGYDGKSAGALKEALDRGAATSLFLQSPSGELPCGGRSSEHIWADALQCVIFELAAAKAVKDKDLPLAGMYKRAARKALRAIRFWQRPTGEFWIVKNRSDPAWQHGYEVYSSHSQYNLLALTALGYAYQHAGETEFVEEHTTPSEQGHYIVDLPKPFSKVVAGNAGTQVIVARAREGNSSPAGLLRIHFHDGVPQVGLSDGVLAETGCVLPKTKRANLSIGLAWKTGGAWRSLADLSNLSSTVTDTDTSEGETRFKVSYSFGNDPVSQVSESYSLSRNRLQVHYDMVGAVDSVAVRVPITTSDGHEENTLSVGDNSVSVSLRGRTVTYSVDGARPRISTEAFGLRNGLARIADFELAPGKDIRLTVDYTEVPS